MKREVGKYSILLTVLTILDMKSCPVFPRTLDIQSPKQLENVYLGDMKKFIIYEGQKKQLENVYLGNIKKFIIYGVQKNSWRMCTWAT